MQNNIWSRTRLLFAFVMALAIVSIATTATRAAEWPKKPIRIIVPFKAGGSVDRMARGLSSFLTYELNVPVTVLNKPGAGGQLGHTYFLQQPSDGYTLLVSPATPYIANNILITGAKYKLSDFAFINAQWSDWTLVATAKKKPYKTFGDLIDTIKKKPGKISTGVTFSSAGHLSTLALLDALGLKPDALRIVTYDGGGPLRTSLAGGQIDFAVVQANGSEVIRDEIRPLAAFLKKKDKKWDAPPINKALKPYGTKVALIRGSIRVIAAQASFRKKHPGRWKTLVAGYKKTIKRKDYKRWLKRSKIGGDWLGPKATTALLEENFEVLKKYKHLLKKK